MKKIEQIKKDTDKEPVSKEDEDCKLCEYYTCKSKCEMCEEMCNDKKFGLIASSIAFGVVTIISFIINVIMIAYVTSSVDHSLLETLIILSNVVILMASLVTAGLLILLIPLIKKDLIIEKAEKQFIELHNVYRKSLKYSFVIFLFVILITYFIFFL